MKNSAPNLASNSPTLKSVTGVQIMQGIGVRPSVGYWTEVWNTVTQRRTALFALAWLGTVGFFAIFAPLLASGHPFAFTLTTDAGVTRTTYPLWQSLSSLDLFLILWGTLTLPFVLLSPRAARGRRFGIAIGALLVGVVLLATSGVINARLANSAEELIRDAATRAARTKSPPEKVFPFTRQPGAGYIVGGVVALIVLSLLAIVPIGRRVPRLAVGLVALTAATACVGLRWERPLERFNYISAEIAGNAHAHYTLIPWSPTQRFSALDRSSPMTVLGPALKLQADAPPSSRRFLLGTDAFGSDVLSQLLHACRLSISIGLVSTSISLLIGVTLGALMGYFGGWVDLLLYRVVEVFQAVPVLFLLIVSAAVLPNEFRTTYVMMAIIGCFSWTGVARFTRAEFLKLRNQDFVQAAVASGLPLRSVLFKHILPNGVAPVLVDTSFAIAAAISIEAVLSYLGLGPVDSASWGKLLSSAVSSEGAFKWWLAVFPGAAIFFTVLSYNLLGEALRDAIDPKLKKARV